MRTVWRARTRLALSSSSPSPIHTWRLPSVPELLGFRASGSYFFTTEVMDWMTIEAILKASLRSYALLTRTMPSSVSARGLVMLNSRSPAIKTAETLVTIRAIISFLLLSASSKFARQQDATRLPRERWYHHRSRRSLLHILWSFLSWSTSPT